jgi:ubiquinone biosynthesis protein
MSLSGSIIDIAPLVPPRYARYRPVIADSFAYFLGHLAPNRLEEILAEQSRLPPDTGLPRRFAALIRCCPTLHKLGQVLARDRRLDPMLRRWLQTLESLPRRRVPDAVVRRLDVELAGFDRTGVRVASHALAEASVALVVPFTLSAGEEGGVVEGVFKILKPGIEARLEEELAIWAKLGAYIDGRCADCGLPEIRYEEAVSSVGRLLAGEVHLDREQAHMREAGGLCGAPSLAVPRLLPFCTPRLTAMERVVGRKVTDTDGLSAPGRLGLADRRGNGGGSRRDRARGRPCGSAHAAAIGI